MDARPDTDVAGVAARENRVLVTENVMDFARTEDVVIVCVLKSRLRTHGMDEHLATEIAAYRITYGVTSRRVPLGDPPPADASRRSAWHGQLAAALQKLD